MLNSYEKEKIKLLTRGIEGVSFEDETFARAFLSLTSTEPAVVIIGPGGTGKSVLIKCLSRIYGSDCLCVAPTGVASHNLEVDGNQAYTIHSALGIPVKPYYDSTEVYAKTLAALSGKKKLLIDEGSMISSNLLETILRHVAITNLNRRSMESRLTVAIFCDPLQLPPVFQKDKMELVLEEKPDLETKWDFFHADMLRELDPKVYILKTVYRQKDPFFRKVLANVRIGEPSQEDIDFLNSKVRDDAGSVIICPTNVIVDEVNQRYLDALAKVEVPYAYDAEYIRGNRIKDTGFSDHVEIYIGCRVMTTRNMYDEYGNAIFQNGSIGEVIAFEKGDDAIPLPVVKADDGREFVVPRMEFSEGTFKKNPDTGKLEYVTIASAIQVPIRPCYAMTYHKCQGLTLPSAHLVLPKKPQAGILYMGLSRCKDHEKLSLSEKVTKDMFKVSESAKKFIQDVESEGHIR